jgi:CBS domain containing-hemolysin-like protein
LSFHGLQFEITVMAGPRIDRVRLILPTSDEVSD